MSLEYFMENLQQFYFCVIAEKIKIWSGGSVRVESIPIFNQPAQSFLVDFETNFKHS